MGLMGLFWKVLESFLLKKKTGPYQGLWGLPGGKIEFGETPEDTVKRELLEESSLTVIRLEFFTIATATGEFYENSQPYDFHQVGLIYRILDWNEHPNRVTEEKNRWVVLDNISYQELTPFAAQTVSKLAKSHSWKPNSSIRGKVIGLAKQDGVSSEFGL